MHAQAYEHPQLCESLPTTKSQEILGDGISYATENAREGNRERIQTITDRVVICRPWSKCLHIDLSR